MCLAIPAKIVDIDAKMATVDVGGVTRQASVVLLPEATLGDYVLMHAGFAISLVDENEALETIRLFDELANGMSSADPGTDR
ncbi:MAG: HypC/HybG/HupF family hydrogenase formation chaperone [Thermoleophilia bacterium]